MSETTFELKFKAKNLKEKTNRDRYRSICESYVLSDSEENYFEIEGEKFSYYSNFADPEDVDLHSLFSELEEVGAESPVVEGWYSSTGESMFYVKVLDEILMFESSEEMEDHLLALKRGESGVEVDYGRSSKINTLLVRLHIKAKRKRKKYFDLFEDELKNPQGCFKAVFDSIVSSDSHDLDSHDLEWGRFKWKEDEEWNFAFSPELIDALVDVKEDDDFLLLAFDLEKSSVSIGDFIWFVFFGLDGVRKVWVKYRRGNKQLYLHHPGMGDEAVFIDRKIKNDNDWPQLG